MLVIVPTYRRHSNGEAQTFDHVPKDFALTLVVRADEVEEYKAMLAKKGRVNDRIWIIPDGCVNGIATTRQWIVDKALEELESKIFMIDDDLHFIVRGKMEDPTNDVHLRPCDDEDFREMIRWVDTQLDTHAHCAISMREGNNRVAGFHATQSATRGIRAVGYCVDTLNDHELMFRDEVEGREDLDMTLQLLRLGYSNIVTYHWAQGQRTADAAGGLHGTRDGEQLDRTAVRLSELHPTFVKLRKKINKSGGMAGERTEVTVYWKKALEAGVRLASTPT